MLQFLNEVFKVRLTKNSYVILANTPITVLLNIAKHFKKKRECVSWNTTSSQYKTIKPFTFKQIFKICLFNASKFSKLIKNTLILFSCFPEILKSIVNVYRLIIMSFLSTDRLTVVV